MVDSDPDYDLFYDYDHNGKVVGIDPLILCCMFTLLYIA